MILVDIQKPPSAENSVILLHPDDNIAVARLALLDGHAVETGGQRLATLNSIPMGHKVALRRIAPGEMIQRYGQAIGRARKEILPGQHVHTHHVEFEGLHFNY